MSFDLLFMHLKQRVAVNVHAWLIFNVLAVKTPVRILDFFLKILFLVFWGSNPALS